MIISKYSRVCDQIHSGSRAFLRAFRRDERGEIIILTLLLLITMLIMGGMAVDFMRFESKRVVLQDATDRAVLAAADLDQTIDPEDVIYEYFEASGYDRSVVTPNILRNSASVREIEVTSQIDMDTIFLRLVGIDDLTAPAASTAREGVNKVEVSLVLDYSLSMTKGESGDVTEFGSGRGKIGDLQDAARDFANTLLDPAYNGRFSLNIVPYAGHVNPGPDMHAFLGGNGLDPFVLTDDDPTDGPFDLAETVWWADVDPLGFPGTWIYEDSNGDEFDITELVGGLVLGDGDVDELTPAQFNALSTTIDQIPDDLFGIDEIYGTSDDNLDGEVRYEYTPPSHCLAIADTDWDNSEIPSSGQEDIPVFSRYASEEWEIEDGVKAWGWCLPDTMRIQYGMQDPALVNAFFNTITTAHGTGSDIGMKWGLALLDPSFQAAFTHLNTIDDADGNPLVPDASLGRPAAWDDEDTDKVLVLMTDGFITSQFVASNPLDVENLSIQTSLRDRSRRSGNTANTPHEEKTVDVVDTEARLLELCEMAKDSTRNVTVYTIAFETSDEAGAVMEQCASSYAHYNAASGTGITDVLDDIARQITQLRLTD